MKIRMAGCIVNMTRWYEFVAGSRSSANGTKFDVVIDVESTSW